MKLTSTPTVTVAVRLATSGSEKEESRCGEFVTERNMYVKAQNSDVMNRD